MMAKYNKDAKFWRYSIEEVAGMLETDAERGLSEEEAAARLVFFGKNAIKGKKGAGRLKIFLNQLQSPLILILLAAGVVTMAISHYRDAIFIFTAVVVNSILGFWQENKAEQSLAKLKTYLKERIRVIRGGKEREIDAVELVPGDIIRLSQGDRVSADARIMFINDLQIDESVISGESLPVTKSTALAPSDAGVSDQHSMVLAGTLVTQGVCAAIVCRTGGNTVFGGIASLVAKSENPKTPLQKAIAKFSVSISILLGALTVGVFVFGIASGRPILEMFLTSVAIAISSIPEGLPVSMTVILAIGVERMARRRAIVRKLVAAEALGSASVILTDKTGTLTEAKMVLSRIIPFDTPEKEALDLALANANVLIENPEDEPANWRMNGRIMEIALVRSAAERGIGFSKISDRSRLLQTVPFNAVKKYSSSYIKQGNKHLVVVIGAPEILLRHAKLSDDRKKEIREQIDALAYSGERLIALATKEVDGPENFTLSKDFKLMDVSFGALISFRDPVRHEVKKAVERVSRAGIKTVILTGDHLGTALAVAREIGLSDDPKAALDASELTEMSDEALRRRLPELRVISRVTPFDKLRIAKLYQESGETVAMTGDGVNDAPVIKQADVGIAMGSGTEVAQSVADLVLLDDNYETIVAAIEEGRRILQNIRKVLVYLLSTVADELILIGGSIVFGVALPLSALQILWVNFFSDSFPAIAFAFEKDGDGLRLPRLKRKQITLLDPFSRFLVLGVGISTSILLFIVYFGLLRFGYDPVLVRTFIFATFGTYSLIAALALRSFDKSVFTYPFFSNPPLLGGLMIGIVLMAAAVYLPPLQSIFGTVSLSGIWLVGVVVIGLANLGLIEAAKFFRRRAIRAAHARQAA